MGFARLSQGRRRTGRRKARAPIKAVLRLEAWGWGMRIAKWFFVLILGACAQLQPASAPTHSLALDHVWFATRSGALAERAALERAGFRIAPDINRHDGQGTASITVEFENGY